MGAKLQHIIATLALESAGISERFAGPRIKPRDELFWFNKPELLLSLIHFILFQVGQFHCNSNPDFLASFSFKFLYDAPSAGLNMMYCC